MSYSFVKKTVFLDLLWNFVTKIMKQYNTLFRFSQSLSHTFEQYNTNNNKKTVNRCVFFIYLMKLKSSDISVTQSFSNEYFCYGFCIRHMMWLTYSKETKFWFWQEYIRELVFGSKTENLFIESKAALCLYIFQKAIFCW